MKPGKVVHDSSSIDHRPVDHRPHSCNSAYIQWTCNNKKAAVEPTSGKESE